MMTMQYKMQVEQIVSDPNIPQHLPWLVNLVVYLAVDL